MSEFTEQQIADWRKYEKVRKGGRFNMFDPRAKKATGLDQERFLFALRNYTALKTAAESATAQSN